MSCVDADVRVGDTGTEIDFRVLDQDGVAVDVSTATLTMYFVKPDGTTLGPKTAQPGSVLAAATRLATAGWCYYITVAGDIDMRGSWIVEVVYVLGGKQLTSTPDTFFVESPRHG